MIARSLDRPRRNLVLILVAALVAAFVGAAVWAANQPETQPGVDMSKGKRRSGLVESSVINGPAGQPVQVQAAPAGGWTTQTRLGFTVGDQWEPAIAADDLGHVYVLYAQYLGVPGCPDCLSPTQVLQVSADRGATWSAPRPLQQPGQRGWDSQIVVDPVDGRTVWASWIEKDKSDVMVARSDDFGATWSITAVDDTNAGLDKPILAVRGDDIYVAYNHSTTIWVSSSHDRGETWTSVKGQTTGKGKIGWSLAGGGTVTPNGDALFGWAGYEQNGVAKGPVNLYVSSTRDGGETWQDTRIETSGSPPDCSADSCGWAYLGAQLTLASDDDGVVYGLWNAGPLTPKRAPERIFFATSTDGGRTWSAKEDVSSAPSGVAHAFPAIVAEGSGDVRIAWMDARNADGDLWNVYYRSSTDGGETWSAEADISTFVPGFEYIQADGFEFPFGDYYELAIDDRGQTQAIFGEGISYDTPGSIWYARGE
ncbi:MAG: sialidase family protein [Candidatus Limnocylindrales bacterium]